MQTLQIIAPYAFRLAFIGLLESLLTAQLLDELTDTGRDKDRESRGQGVANVASGFLGGIAGCAMIGQSMINVKSGGSTRLSTFSGGFFLLVLIMALGDFVAVIPMAALVAVMFIVAAATFNWTPCAGRASSERPRATPRSCSPPSESSSGRSTLRTASSPACCWPRSFSPGASRTWSRSPV